MKSLAIQVSVLLVTEYTLSAAVVNHGPLTDHFSSWLTKWLASKPNYARFLKSKYNLVRNDLGMIGSFGGRINAEQPVQHNPVIFIHGNSDTALADKAVWWRFAYTGWTASINHFQSKGYTSAELYATTWGEGGDMNPLKALDQIQACAWLTYLRAFVEAVIAYTGKSKINIISHGMGVTMARKVIQGGQHIDSLRDHSNIRPSS